MPIRTPSGLDSPNQLCEETSEDVEEDENGQDGYETDGGISLGDGSLSFEVDEGRVLGELTGRSKGRIGDAGVSSSVGMLLFPLKTFEERTGGTMP